MASRWINITNDFNRKNFLISLSQIRTVKKEKEFNFKEERYYWCIYIVTDNDELKIHHGEKKKPADDVYNRIYNFINHPEEYSANILDVKYLDEKEKERERF